MVLLGCVCVLEGGVFDCAVDLHGCGCLCYGLFMYVVIWFCVVCGYLVFCEAVCVGF